MKWFLIAAALCGLAGTARAEEFAARQWHAGLDLRTKLDAHPVRLDGGVQLGQLDLTLVVDPMFWTDGQVDTDLLAQWHFSPNGYGVMAGWRTTAIGLAGGREFQEKLLLGFVGQLPQLWGGRIRPQWGVELASVIAKHGAGIPAEVLSFKNSRFYVDLLNFGMFVRVDYASPF